MKVYIPHKTTEKHVEGSKSMLPGTAMYVTTLLCTFLLYGITTVPETLKQVFIVSKNKVLERMEGTKRGSRELMGCIQDSHFRVNQVLL